MWLRLLMTYWCVITEDTFTSLFATKHLITPPPPPRRVTEGPLSANCVARCTSRAPSCKHNTCAALWLGDGARFTCRRSSSLAVVGCNLTAIIASGVNSQLIGESPRNRRTHASPTPLPFSASLGGLLSVANLHGPVNLPVYWERGACILACGGAKQSPPWLRDRRELSRRHIPADPRLWHFAFAGRR